MVQGAPYRFPELARFASHCEVFLALIFTPLIFRGFFFLAWGMQVTPRKRKDCPDTWPVAVATGNPDPDAATGP